MSSQPSNHAAWKLSNDTNPQTVMNVAAAAFHSGSSSPVAPSYPANQSMASTPISHGPQTSARKRQFRFSVRADIDLLKLVIKMNPYGAPHGGRLHKWQAIANTLRESGIDIDFRRARDRTGLLLDQWREQELSLLRRSGSGNHQDQAQKERLLETISEIEHAARPRDNSHEWRNREQARMRTNSQSNFPVRVNTSLPLPEIPTNQSALNAIAATDQRTNKFSSNSTSLHPQSHLPPIMQKHDPTQHVLSQAAVDSELRSISQYATHQGPPEKQFKNNQGQPINPRFSQPLYGHPPSPKPSPPFHSQPSQERGTPPRSDMSPFRGDLPLLRTGQQLHRSNNPHVLAPAPLDVGTVHAVTTSPRIGEGQNIQLDPMQPGLLRQSSLNVETEQLRAHILRLEKRLDQVSQISEKRLQLDERRLAWEQQREDKRLQLERDRIEKEFEDRKAEREERRRLQQSEKEERDRMLKIIVQSHQQVQSDTENHD